MPKSRQRRSRDQEIAGAKAIGGRRVPGSGSGWATKNDIKNDVLSIEMKYTDNKSYSLTVADLKKAENHALLDSGRDFAFIVELGKREYVIVTREFAETRGLLNGSV